MTRDPFFAIVVPLHSGRYAFCDAEDLHLVKEKLWSETSDGYARTTGSELMHRTILGDTVDDSHCVDHINGIKTDNRKTNLRVVSLEGNRLNSKRLQNPYVNFNGVKWETKIRVTGGTFIFVGHYSTEREATAAYNGFQEFLGNKNAMYSIANLSKEEDVAAREGAFVAATMPVSETKVQAESFQGRIRGNKTGYIGVRKSDGSNRFEFTITYKGKSGTGYGFESALLAATSFDAASAELAKASGCNRPSNGTKPVTSSEIRAQEKGEQIAASLIERCST